MSSTCVGALGRAEHARDRVAVDVGVDEADREALRGHRHGEVDGHRRLADAALAGGDGVDPGQGAGLGERDLALVVAAAQRRAAPCAARRSSRRARRRPRSTPGTAPTAVGHVAGDGVAHRAAGHREQHGDRATPSATSRDLTISSSVMGRWISGSLTVARAASTCSSRVSGMPRCYVRRGRVPPHAVGRRAALSDVDGVDRLGGLGLRLLGRLRLALVALVEVVEQVAQLGAEEVAGGDLAERDPQRRDLAGEVLRVGDEALGAGPVVLVLHPVAVGLAVLREQDQRGGVRRLQREHQRQEDERVRVEAQVLGRERSSTTQTTTNTVM